MTKYQDIALMLEANAITNTVDAYEKGRTDAIDEYKTDIINKIDFEEKWLFDCKSNNADTNIVLSALKTFVENRAEQLKAGGKNDD
jgi:hypothetical protein